MTECTCARGLYAPEAGSEKVMASASTCSWACSCFCSCSCPCSVPGPLSLATAGSLVSLWLLLFPFAPYLSLPSPVPLCYRLPPGFVSVGWDWAGEKLGYRVVSAPTPRMATKYSFNRKIQSFHRAIFLQGLHRIFGTSGRIPARSRCHRRDTIFVEINRQ